MGESVTPPLQKSTCFLHAISVLVHDDNANRSGYNCNVSRGTIPDASNLLQVASNKRKEERTIS